MFLNGKSTDHTISWRERIRMQRRRSRRLRRRMRSKGRPGGPDSESSVAGVDWSHAGAGVGLGLWGFRVGGTRGRGDVRQIWACHVQAV